MQKLNQFLWKYKWKLALGVLFVIASNLVSVYSVNFVRDGINQVEVLSNLYNDGKIERQSELLNGLLLTSLTFIGLKLLSGLLSIGTRQMIIVTSRLIEYDLKNIIFGHYQKLSLSFYKKNKIGDLMNRISEDVGHVRMYLGPGIMYPIDLISRTIILFFFMIRIDMELTFYTLMPLPILSVLIYKVATTINKKSKDLQGQQSQISSVVQDTFSGIRVIKSFNTEDYIKRKYAIDAGLYEKKALSLSQTEAFFGPLMILIVGISNLIILYFGGTKYVEGTLDIGVVGQFFIFLNMLIWPFTSLGWVTMLVQRAEASMERIVEFMSVKPEYENQIKHETPVYGDIEFRNVSYTYENTGITALKDISFKVKKGETMAILGKTGSGKSTVALLIAQLLRPTKGKIYFDGRTQEELNIDSIRDSIGYVPQEAFLFSDTIANNILFGVDDKNPETGIKWAKTAAVHDNIIEFPKGYETFVGERGVTLSGGQKQRVSIARALVKDPNILIFDDSLSAVDTETEEMILNNLNEATKDKTTIIITHRISSAKNAGLIIMLDNGRITETGTHEELLAKNGLYKELFRKQMLDRAF